MERVEHELAGEPEQVERPRPVLGQERARGGEVLAVHDLRRLGVEVLVAAVLLGEPGERRVEVAQLLVRITGLAQLVAPGVRQRRQPVPDLRIGVVPQPRRRLHDVGVGVVHDQPRRVVPHARVSLPGPQARSLSCGVQ